ncbi:MAG: MFS transporter [Candidatus Margulisbacteria bacterium]|nr:MFS transporter [Candidatus Margulisiibacteriota bacterium]
MSKLRKLAYSFGAFATALSYQAFSTYVIFFYVDVQKLPVYLVGLAMLVYGIWNAVNDPLFGYLSDITRTKWGRRVPYIMMGAVPFGLIFFLLWTPPFGGVDQAMPLFIYFLSLICIFDGIYSITVLNWSALFPEMFPSLAERAQVNIYRQSFAILGLLIGIAVPPLIYSTQGWGRMGLYFGVLASLSLLVALWGSRERLEFDRDKQLSLWPALKATLRNRSFLTFAAANLFVQYSFTVILATIPFFAKYVLDANPEQVTGILAAAFFAAIPMLYVWKWLAVKFGAKYCFMASLAVLAFSLLPLFNITTVASVRWAAACAGVGMAGFILLADILIADVIDEDEINTGQRREGMFFGMNAFITRLAIGLNAFSISTVFIYCNYSPYVYTQSLAFHHGLRFLLAGCPAIALAIGFVIMILYPLAGQRLEGQKSKLKEIHIQKGVI